MLSGVEDFVGKIDAFIQAIPRGGLSPNLALHRKGPGRTRLEQSLLSVRPQVSCAWLAYYTGVVFEVFDRARESRALAGGGRYDELVGTISDGAVKHPALGFAVGDVTLLDLLRKLPHTAALLDTATKASGSSRGVRGHRRRGVSSTSA